MIKTFMKKLACVTVFLSIGILFISCKHKGSSGNVDENDSLVAVTDQASKQILVFDSEQEDWDQSNAEWAWAPSNENGFEGLLDSWGHPDGVKLRERKGEEYMVVTDSYGFVGIVPYPAGDHKTWGLNVGSSPHAAELLPDGNIAVALSASPGWIRIYTASEGPDSEHYAEYMLPGAHGVVWDPKEELLWALGTGYIVSLEIKGTRSDPVIEEVHKEQTPTEGGHNLSVVYGDTDKLWVSTTTNVYQYSKSKNEWSEDYPGADDINKPYVKSVGNQPSGQVILTQQNSDIGENVFTTDTIDFYMPTSPQKLKNGEVYKARVWNTDYQ